MSTMPEIGGVDKTIKDLTLVFCRRTITDSEGDANPICRRDEILLGLKKRGFGEGKWNGEVLPVGYAHTEWAVRPILLSVWSPSAA